MTTMLIDRIRIKDLEETIANSTPLLAVVGAGDLAVEKLRAARDELAVRAADFDPKAFRDQAQAGIADRVESFQADMMAAPEQLRALPEKAQEWPVRAQSLFADVVSAAFSTYGELAGRGKSLVTQVRRDVPDAVKVEVDTTPISRPASSPLRTRPVVPRTAAQKAANTSASQQPAAKTAAKKSPARKTATAKTAAKKTAAKKTAKRSAAKKAATSKKTTASTAAAKRSTTAKQASTPS